MRHTKYLCKMAAFGILTCLLLMAVSQILTPKSYYDGMWPTTSAYQGFYQMEKDSIDVLFLGTSCAATGFNPQTLYDNNGIRSYNLGCASQSMLTTYYWLKEALRYQSPKVVVVETYGAFSINSREPLNSSEGSVRAAFDYMRWSKVKWEAVHDICKYDEKQTLNSYYFPNIRYHARWTELTENDFLYQQMEKHYELKGFTPLDEKKGSDSYVPFCWWDSGDRSEMVPLMKEYLDKIVELCRENGISLILTKLPNAECSIAKYNTTADYASEHEIAYWDFNEEDLYYASGFVHAEDMNDTLHVNIWGAEKISAYVASRLQEEYGIMGEEDAQWENTAAYYDRVLQDCELKSITDIEQYIDCISQEQYTILMAVKGDGVSFMDENVKQQFARLGLSMEYEQNESYFAAVHEGKVEEGTSAERLIHHGSTRGGLMDFEITSEGYSSSDEGCADIKIDDDNYSKKRNGINIVVYSNERRQVVDSVNYNGSLAR